MIGKNINNVYLKGAPPPFYRSLHHFLGHVTALNSFPLLVVVVVVVVVAVAVAAAIVVVGAVAVVVAVDVVVDVVVVVVAVVVCFHLSFGFH